MSYRVLCPKHKLETTLPDKEEEYKQLATDIRSVLEHLRKYPKCKFMVIT